MNHNQWWLDSVCYKERLDPAIFTDNKNGRALFTEARKACARCPVRDACLKDLLNNPPLMDGPFSGQEVVVYGYSMFQAGFTPNELNAMQDAYEGRRR